ncbi:type I restriction-modification system subunit M, partial [Rhodococcus rhodochrous]|uniref:type I restriction-modification system subunit M n=1 Tax=Rhodococcus rhodochrous TaxID=1829 RepID=UPI0009BFE1FF
MSRVNDTLLWNISTVLRGPYQPNQYGDVILPFTVLRWLDAIIAPDKEAVLAEYEKVRDRGIDPYRVMSAKFDLPFFNTSVWDFRKLTADPAGLAKNLADYLEGFSPNIRDVLDGYGLPALITDLDRSDRLYLVVKEFANVDLHRISGDDMGYIFDALIRRFAESNNAQVGDHFTPPDIAELMVALLYTDKDLELTAPGITPTIYDPAVGTGGMLSAAYDHLTEMNPTAKPVLCGQEINPRAYAMCKSNMIIKGQNVDNIYLGDTLTDDSFASYHFDFLISNPPFGIEWSTQRKTVTDEHERLGHAGRFGPGLPRVSDGSLLFLMHLVSKMRPAPNPADKGSRLAIVLNDSPMSTGGAGTGESGIRQWIIENDLLDAIIALPTDMFFNTGISTYIWLLDNKKIDQRRGKIQLINAVEMFGKMRKPLGSKRKQLSTEDIQHICKLYQECRHDEGTEEPALSKVFANEDFGYYSITIERPLRLSFHLNKSITERVLADRVITRLTVEEQRCVHEALRALAERSWLNRDEFVADLRTALKNVGMPQPNMMLVKALYMTAGERDPSADAIRTNGKTEADSSLRETKNVPLGEDVEDYFAREVLPEAPDAWIDHERTRVGYRISWTQFLFDEFDCPVKPLEYFVSLEPEQMHRFEEGAGPEEPNGVRVLRAQDLHTADTAMDLPLDTPAPRKLRRCAGSTIVGISGNWRMLPPDFGEAVTSMYVLRPRNGASGFALCEWMNSFNQNAHMRQRNRFLDIPVPIEIVTDAEINESLAQVTDTRRRLQTTISKMLSNSFTSRERTVLEIRTAIASNVHEARTVDRLIQPLEDPIWRAESSYPFHVAALARHHRIRSHPAERVDSLLKLGEGLARTLGVMCLAEMSRTIGFNSSIQRKFRTGASFGTWTTLIQQMIDRGEPPLISHLQSLGNPDGILGLLGKIREYRNTTHHSHGVRVEHEMNTLAANLEPHIASAIAKASWLSENQWIWVERCEYLDNDSYRIVGLRMHGSHPGWEPIERRSPVPLRPSRIYVEDAYLGTSLDLSPFAVVELCERCQVRELFLLDQTLPGGTLVLRSLVEHSLD